MTLDRSLKSRLSSTGKLSAVAARRLSAAVREWLVWKLHLAAIDGVSPLGQRSSSNGIAHTAAIPDAAGGGAACVDLWCCNGSGAEDAQKSNDVGELHIEV